MGYYFNMYTHGFIRVAACIPGVKVSDPAHNAERTIEHVREACDRKASLALFPELGLSGYSNEDLFFQDALLDGVLNALRRLLDATYNLDIVFAAGAPLKVMGALFNCAIVMHKGRILGVAVKSYLPNYREFYELRQFRSASDLMADTFELLGQRVPIGADLIFRMENMPGFSLFLELCEDVWVPIPPSCYAAMAGATVIGNLSASNITVGKDEYRHALVANQSARLMSGYIYTAAGPGESTTDLAWDGHAMVYENGNLLAESERFIWQPRVIVADIDLDRLLQDRSRMTSFAANRQAHRERTAFREIVVPVGVPQGRILLERDIPRFPYVPADPSLREKRCYEVYHIQVQGLVKRMQSSGVKNLVIGVSGGLDSTHALIVCARTMDTLGLPRNNIKAYTLPGFATSEKTHANAVRLMRELNVEAGEIDIRPACEMMLKDIGHPFADGQAVYDVTFENVQAGQRTSLLFRIANQVGGLVVGTGDLSELSLGWCTYGVGDQMSHYAVNASVPKTLIQYILRWIAAGDVMGDGVSRCLEDILATEISPELIPGTVGGQPGQRTEEVIGPYELQDFNTFYFSRYGYRPSKIAFMAWHAWRDRTLGRWPDVPQEKRNSYELAAIKHWLGVFIHRFFKFSQYKRSCIPNGPKVGSGGSLSPRGDYRAPSDSEDAPWLADWEKIPDVKGE